MTLIQLLCMTSLLSVIQAVRIQSYNVALINLVDNYKTRKSSFFKTLELEDYDVMCLQEVWYGSDVITIKNLVGNGVFAYTAPLFQETVLWGWLKVPPCHKATLTVGCIVYRCSKFTNKKELTDCSVDCGLMTESQECISCLVVSGKQVMRCFDYVKREAMNVPGVMLLSRKRVTSAKSVFFEPGVKEILKRAYIEAEIEDVGTVICSHTSADIGRHYYEPNLKDVYSSWEEQNLADAKKLTAAALMSNKPLIMGDLNTSPAIPAFNVTADFEGAYNYIVSQGFTSPYVSMVGKCTFCVDNPLSHDRNLNYVLDHVFIRSHTVLDAKRIHDEDIPHENFPTSDHYGIEVEIEN